MGFLGRLLGNEPPKIPAGASVLLAPALSASIGGGTWSQRPYWVMLNADRQEVGPRTWLRRQSFTDLDYAGRWCAWVQAQGALPALDVPTVAE